jgi:hypothetical protein
MGCKPTLPTISPQLRSGECKLWIIYALARESGGD